MSIDYDKLREQLDESTPGPWKAWGIYDDGAPRPDTSRYMRARDEYLGIMHTPDADLAALAPELARELLNLRDGVTELRDELADLHHAGRVYRGRKTDATVPAGVFAYHLTRLLDGEHYDH